MQHSPIADPILTNLNDKLYKACKDGDIKSVETAIIEGAEDLNWGLRAACEGGHTDLVKLLIKKGVNGANCWNEGLYYACKGDHIDIVKLMLNQGANVLDHGFMVACDRGCVEIVKLMINKNSDTGYYGLRNDVGLYRACERGYMEIIELILIDGVGSHEWGYCLEHACKGNNMNVVELFIAKCAERAIKEKQYTDRNYWNYGLRGSCLGGHIDLVKFMIEKGADDWNGGLKKACEGGHLEIVELLIEKGADDWNGGLTGVCRGCSGDGSEDGSEDGSGDGSEDGSGDGSKNSLKLIELMIAKGANDWNGGLVSACGEGNIDLAKLMIEKGANDWNYGLWRSCRGGYMDIVELMIAKGANDWNVGLCDACEGGHIKIVELMIAKGANNWEEGLESLFSACDYIQLSLFELIVRCGRDGDGDGDSEVLDLDQCMLDNYEQLDISKIKILIKYGYSDWDAGLLMACEHGDVNVAELMISHGATNFDECSEVLFGYKDPESIALVSKTRDLLVSKNNE